VYSNLIDPTSHAKVTIRVKPKTEPNPTSKIHRASGLHPNHPGVDVEKRMIDGYIFKNYDDEFLEACENKYQGFGACSSATIIPTVGVDFATFDMESWFSELNATHAKSDNLTEVLSQEQTDVTKQKNVKQYVHKVHSNVSQHTYPNGASINRSADISWMLNRNAVTSLNVHLLRKLLLWQKGHTSYTDKVLSSNDLPNAVAYHQTKFVETLVKRAILGIRGCNIPVWIISEDRMVEIIDGIDTLPVAQLVKNFASYDQFFFECDLSVCSKYLYVKTIHHGYIFDNDEREYFYEVFYGLDYKSHVRHV
jgi:hypothetical protein